MTTNRTMKLIAAGVASAALALLPLAANAAVVNGTNGNDTIVAPQTGPDADTVTALAGNDRVETYGGNDWINGGRGNDNVKGGAGNDTLLDAGDQNDTFAGNSGDDGLRTLFGGDTLYGGGGADDLRPGPGVDTTVAGEGSDFIQVGSDSARDSIQCGDGADTVHYTTAAADPLDTLTGCDNVTVTPPV